MRNFIFLVLIFFVISKSSAQWTGSVNLVEKYIGKGIFAGSSREKHIDLSFTGTLPSLDHDDPSNPGNNDKGTGSITDRTESPRGNCGCRGTGVAILDEVGLHPDGTYRIAASGPECKGSGSGDGSCGTSMDIVIDDQPLGSNHNILNGSYTTTVTDDNGTLISTYTWHLERSNDVVLIVSPLKYDDWLPKPGRDETTKGSAIVIKLAIQKRNGQPSALKAKTFEITLSNTSREPGITLNYPLNPASKQLPDLRLLKDDRMESWDEDQFISMHCEDGKTGQLSIGAYDGGGYATLTAIAILDDETRVTGHLFVPTGVQEISIPKRNGSMIADFWKNSNGNPGDYDDTEKSKENSYNGDGLTAYEEYRGVISEGSYKRLDPRKKELGVTLQRSTIGQFSQGLGWFKSASEIEIIQFYVHEIASDNRLNRNFSSGHTYDQCAILLMPGFLPEGVVGRTYTTNNKPNVPAQVKRIVIDVNQVASLYPQFIAHVRPQPVPFSEAELLANTIAHELGHAVNLPHHGQEANLSSPETATSTSIPVFYIYDIHGREITTRPFIIEGNIGVSGNEQSGDLSCFIAYNPYCDWAYKTGIGGSRIFYLVPPYAMGRTLCNSQTGTGINKPAGNNTSNNYFGNANAAAGKCIEKIKLKN